MTTISSQRFSALTSGVSLIIMAAVAGFAYGGVFSKLVVSDNAFETAKRITENSSLYWCGLFAWMIVLGLDLIVSIALFRFFKHVDKRLSFIAMLFRLGYSLFLAVGIVFLFRAMTANAAALEEVKAFQFIWSIGLILFGGHLITLAILAYRAIDVPKIWGILLFVAGSSYVICHCSKLLFGELTQVILLENILSIPMVVGELGFAVWLLVYARKLKRAIV